MDEAEPKRSLTGRTEEEIIKCRTAASGWGWRQDTRVNERGGGGAAKQREIESGRGGGTKVLLNRTPTKHDACFLVAMDVGRQWKTNMGLRAVWVWMPLVPATVISTSWQVIPVMYSAKCRHVYAHIWFYTVTTKRPRITSPPHPPPTSPSLQLLRTRV